MSKENKKQGQQADHAKHGKAEHTKHGQTGHNKAEHGSKVEHGKAGKHAKPESLNKEQEQGDWKSKGNTWEKK